MDITGKTALVTGPTVAWDGSWPRSFGTGRPRLRRDPQAVDLAGVTPIALDGIEADDAEIIADETSRRVLAGLSAGVTGLYPQVA